MSSLVDSAQAVVARFGEVDGRLLAAALLLHVANHGLRSLAWRNVLAAAYPSTRVPYLGVASAYAVGVALNAVVPGRGGDAAKVAMVRFGIGGSSVATIASTMSVVVLFDLVAATLPRFASEAHKDPRAPQNLYPIAGLEHRLRHLLGDQLVLDRALRRAADGR